MVGSNPTPIPISIPRREEGGREWGLHPVSQSVLQYGHFIVPIMTMCEHVKTNFNYF